MHVIEQLYCSTSVTFLFFRLLNLTTSLIFTPSSIDISLYIFCTMYNVSIRWNNKSKQILLDSDPAKACRFLSKVCLSGDRRVKACLTALKQEKKKKKLKPRSTEQVSFYVGRFIAFTNTSWHWPLLYIWLHGEASMLSTSSRRALTLHGHICVKYCFYKSFFFKPWTQMVGFAEDIAIKQVRSSKWHEHELSLSVFVLAFVKALTFCKDTVTLWLIITK